MKFLILFLLLSSFLLSSLLSWLCSRCRYYRCPCYFCCHFSCSYFWKQGAVYCFVVLVTVAVCPSIPWFSSPWLRLNLNMHCLIWNGKRSCLLITSHHLTLWIFFFASRKKRGLCCEPVPLEETGRHFLFLLVITERMHLKVREICGKQLIFWEMETGLLYHCCCSFCCCSAPSLVFFVLCSELCLIAVVVPLPPFRSSSYLCRLEL